MIHDSIRHSTSMYAAVAILCIVTNVIAFAFQFFYYELPCPLCLLQRFGFLAIGLGATLSLIDRPALKYDIIIVISSLFTLTVGLRQVLLHIAIPNSGYGSTFFGLHFYTWSAILSFALILLMSIASAISVTLSKLNISEYSHKSMTTLILYTFIIISLMNVIATYFECGFGMCPADPTTYLEWKNIFK